MNQTTQTGMVSNDPTFSAKTVFYQIFALVKCGIIGRMLPKLHCSPARFSFCRGLFFFRSFFYLKTLSTLYGSEFFENWRREHKR